MINTLGDYLYPPDTSFEFTINDMVNSNKRAIVTMETMDNDELLWPSDSIYNTYADTPDLQEMIDFNTETVKQFMNNDWPGGLFKISWILTPDAESIKDAILAGFPSSLLQLADIAALPLPYFWEAMKKKSWRIGNIFIIDHYETSDIVKITLDMNGVSSSSIKG